MSRTPEGSIKDYLVARIEALGGLVRFTKYIGRDSCPDTRVMIPCGPGHFPLPARSHWVETKAKNGSLSPGQSREFKRLAEAGDPVLVLHTTALIDAHFPAPL